VPVKVHVFCKSLRECDDYSTPFVQSIVVKAMLGPLKEQGKVCSVTQQQQQQKTPTNISNVVTHVTLERLPGSVNDNNSES
jgi:hypothetical protein